MYWSTVTWGQPMPIMSSGESVDMQRFCQVDEEDKSLMRAVVHQMDLSALAQ